MSIVEQLDLIIQHLQTIRDDAVKVDRGQLSTPATRVRTNAQAAKKALDALRKNVQGLRN
jgi:hypothetical protein